MANGMNTDMARLLARTLAEGNEGVAIAFVNELLAAIEEVQKAEEADGGAIESGQQARIVTDLESMVNEVFEGDGALEDAAAASAAFVAGEAIESIIEKINERLVSDLDLSEDDDVLADHVIDLLGGM